MCAVASPSDGAPVAAAAALASVRAVGGVSLHAGATGGRSAVRILRQSGGYRLALPATFARHLEVSQLNTGGGVAGGDRVETSVVSEGGADVVFSTQGAERIYRSDVMAAEVNVRLTVADGARLDWLPQQTILYAGARMRRRIEADVAPDGRLLMVEVLTFGRPASVEADGPVLMEDRWRVRRGGRLVLAEALSLRGGLAPTLGKPAVGGGARSSAVVVYVAPDAPDRLEEARGSLDGLTCEWGVSAWNGLLAARILARAPGDVIAASARLARTLARREMPRVWAI